MGASAGVGSTGGERPGSAGRPRKITARIDPPLARTGIGVVAPFDFALDREAWRLVPDGVTLHVTRTPYEGLPVGVELAERVSAAGMVGRCCRDLSVALPAVTVYLCTSGSFVDGLRGEAELRAVMEEHGALRALTASGALLEALEALEVTRVGVGTPYAVDLTTRLDAFLGEAGYEPVRAAYLGLTGRIPQVSRDTVRALARAACSDEAEAVFLACTNLPTVDVLAELEQELGRPVLSANLVSMWAALRSLQALTDERPELLFQRTAGIGPAV